MMAENVALLTHGGGTEKVPAILYFFSYHLVVEYKDYNVGPKRASFITTIIRQSVYI